MTDTLPAAESGAVEAPRITVTTPADQLAHAQSLLPADEETTPESTPDAPEPDEGAESDPESSPEETEAEAKAKPPKGVQKRLDELTREKYEAQRRADAMQAQLERALTMLERNQAPAPEPVPVDANASPDPSAYPDGELDRGYIKDLARYEARQELIAYQAQEAHNRTVAEIRAREDAARAKYADYNEVVTQQRFAPLLAANPGVVQALMEHESGPDLAYYLGQHPDELQSLARLRAPAAAMRLGQLLSGLTPPEPPAKPAKPVTPAPAPITPLRGSGAAPAINMEQQLEALEVAGDYDRWRALKHASRK